MPSPPPDFLQSHEIANCIAEDLKEFVRHTHVDLAQMFMFPPEYVQNSEDIILMLYEDISHMLRDQIAKGIHLLLAECDIDPNTGQYPLRYHVEYSIDPTPLPPGQPPYGGNLVPPKKIWHNARFVLLLDWNPNMPDHIQNVRRPEYCFDWIAEEPRFDASMLVSHPTMDAMATITGGQLLRKATISPAYY